jgi:hypothetical protein
MRIAESMPNFPGPVKAEIKIYNGIAALNYGFFKFKEGSNLSLAQKLAKIAISE